MSKKDYVLIARVIRNLVESPECRKRTALDFAKALYADNSRFDVPKFLKACGV